MFTLFYGPVGSGKTQALVREARKAYERGEPIFANIDIDPRAGGWRHCDRGLYFPDPKAWGEFLRLVKAGKSEWNEDAPVIVRWSEPIDLIELLDEHPAVRCGTVLFDELGAVANSKVTASWPYELILKMIEHRKDHLDFFATAQEAHMANRTLRDFYNVCYRCREIRLPLLGLLRPGSRRPDKSCGFPLCRKNCGLHIRGDRWGWGTVYRLKDIDPKRTENVAKFESAGSRWFLFDRRTAAAYATQSKVSKEAARWVRRARADYRRNRNAPRPPDPDADASGPAGAAVLPF